MGAWGTGPWDNDTAASWAANLTELSASELDRQLRDTRGLGDDSRRGEMIVAACELVAWMVSKHGQSNSHAEDAIRWAAGQSADGTLTSHAAAALAAVIGPHSALRQSWEDAGAEAHAAWQAEIGMIRQRLAGSVAADGREWDDGRRTFGLPDGSEVRLTTPTGREIWLGEPELITVLEAVLVVQLTASYHGHFETRVDRTRDGSAATICDYDSWQDDSVIVTIPGWSIVAADIDGARMTIIAMRQ